MAKGRSSSRAPTRTPTARTPPPRKPAARAPAKRPGPSVPGGKGIVAGALASALGADGLRRWLVKSEPDVYGIDDLARDGRTAWTGVRNHQARNFLRDHMKEGDLVLFYHSNADPSGAAGVGRVAKQGYPDPTQFSRAKGKDPMGYDPRSDPADPTWFVVDVAFVERFPRVVPLADLKADPALKDMLVTTPNRLSVQPVSPPHFDRVVALGRGARADRKG